MSHNAGYLNKVKQLFNRIASWKILYLAKPFILTFMFLNSIERAKKPLEEDI